MKIIVIKWQISKLFKLVTCVRVEIVADAADSSRESY